MRAKEFIIESSQVELRHEFWSDGTELHIEARVQGQVVGSVDFVRPEPMENDTVWESENVTVDEKFRRAGIATAMYNLAKKLVEPGYIVPSPNQSVGGKALWKDRQVWEQGVEEAFNQPYATDLEKSEHDDYDSLVQLPDGSHLSVMFNNQGDGEYQVEFWRGPSQGVTGEGDAQRIFATVLSTIQRFIKEHNPWRLTFSATKDVELGQNSESRAKLYNRLVDRYAAAWGYDALINDLGDQVEYELTRLKPNVAEGFPNFNREWDEATRYPEFVNLGKKKWIELVSKGKQVTVTRKNVNKINNTDAADPNSFKLLDPEKQKRALAQLANGDVEMPIVARYSDGYLELIGGNTRLTAQMAKDGQAKVWLFNVPEELTQGMAENFADGKVKGKSRPGRVKRAGASCNGSVTDLRQRAKNASGEKAKMYHWCANMKSGRSKK